MPLAVTPAADCPLDTQEYFVEDTTPLSDYLPMVNDVLQSHTGQRVSLRGYPLTNATPETLSKLFNVIDGHDATLDTVHVPIDGIDIEQYNHLTNAGVSVDLFIDSINSIFKVADGDVTPQNEILQQATEDQHVSVTLVPTCEDGQFNHSDFQKIIHHMDAEGIAGWIYPEPRKTRAPARLSNKDMSELYESIWDWIIESSGALWEPFRSYQDNLLGLGLQGCVGREYNVIVANSSILSANSDENIDTIPQIGRYEGLEREYELRQMEMPDDISDSEGGCQGCEFWSVCQGGPSTHSTGEQGDGTRSRWCETIYNTYETIRYDMERLFPGQSFITDLEWDLDTESLAVRGELDVNPVTNYDMRYVEKNRPGIKGNNPNAPSLREQVESAWERASVSKEEYRSLAAFVVSSHKPAQIESLPATHLYEMFSEGCTGENESGVYVTADCVTSSEEEIGTQDVFDEVLEAFGSDRTTIDWGEGVALVESLSTESGMETDTRAENTEELVDNVRDLKRKNPNTPIVVDQSEMSAHADAQNKRGGGAFNELEDTVRDHYPNSEVSVEKDVIYVRNHQPIRQ